MRKAFLPASFFLILFAHFIYTGTAGYRALRLWAYNVNNPWKAYFSRGDYFLGAAYALSVTFTLFVFLNFLEQRQNNKELAASVSLTGLLYLFGCYLVGCCGSPLLAVYGSFFGASFLGWTKPAIFALTLISVIAGVVWMERRNRVSPPCCAHENSCAGEAR